MKSRQLRQEEAKIRQVGWESCTFEQQIALLDHKLGPGKGARKQRTKIQERVKNAAAPMRVEHLKPPTSLDPGVHSVIAIRAVPKKTKQERKLASQR
jgi:hypothetical protein